MSGIRHGIRVRQRALESVRCAGAGVALATLPGSKRRRLSKDGDTKLNTTYAEMTHGETIGHDLAPITRLER
ncbi:unnamed protein product, partial [Brenthis ino]